jgi:hypothetical protein
MRLTWILVLTLACGGKLDTGDAGNPGNDSGTSGDSTLIGDSSPPTADVIVPPIKCMFGMGSGTVSSDGSCSGTQDYSCGSTTYEITCNCPESACYCKKNGQQTSVTLTTIMCPNCNVMGNIDKLAALCNYPQP